MCRKKITLVLAALAAMFILSAENSFAFRSIGTAVDTFCAPRGVQPFGGNCDLCHNNDTNFNHASSADYAWFCPLPTCTDNDGDTFAVQGGTCGPVDCNDNNAAVNPGAAENCTDGFDNNCNGLIDAQDPAAVGCLVCTDNDSDTYAVEGGACGPVDCNDTDAAVNPGTAESCDDAIDNDCDGSVDEGCDVACPDVDGDGFTDAICGGNDCNDADAAVNPGVQETCGNNIDENCNGNSDEACLTCPDGGVLSISEAEYNRGDRKLVAKGRSHIGTTITLTNADTGAVLAANIPVKGGKWKVEVKRLNTTITGIIATNSEGCTAEMTFKTEGGDHDDGDDDEDDKRRSSRSSKRR